MEADKYREFIEDTGKTKNLKRKPGGVFHKHIMDFTDWRNTEENFKTAGRAEIGDLITKKPFIDIRSYGSISSNMADITSFINEAVRDLSEDNSVIFLPSGSFIIREQVRLENLTGIEIRGCGKATKIFYEGSDYCFLLNNSKFCVMRDFAIMSDNGVKVTVETGKTSIENVFKCLYFQGSSRGIAGSRGILFDAPGGSPGANFFNTVESCYFTQLETDIETSGNANQQNLRGNRYVQYWKAIIINSDENEIEGGFFHNAAGDATPTYTYAVTIKSNKGFNSINGLVGEAGNYSKPYLIESGAMHNTIQIQNNFTHGGDNNSGNFLNSILSSGTWYMGSDIQLDDRNLAGNEITLNDDQAASFTPGNDVGAILIFGRGSVYSDWWILASYRVTSAGTQFCYKMSGAANFDVATGALSGTTGTDTHCTVSANGSDGKIYIENRRGGAVSFGYVLFGR